MVDKNSIMQIIGCLMKKPEILSQIDKYQLEPSDFSSVFERVIFSAIKTLYGNGAKKVSAIDIDNYCETNQMAKKVFNDNNGIEYLQDAEYYAEVINFDVYYNRLKKFNLLNKLKKEGINTDGYYNENLVDPKAIEINDKFERIEIKDILEDVKRKILRVEKDFLQNDVTETRKAYEGIEELLEAASEGADIGMPLQGNILNEVVSGARLGAFYLRSAGSGVGKSRNMVSDACKLAYPFHYDSAYKKWILDGHSEKVLVITTEQDIDEIQKMILAYLTDINESKFRYGMFTDEEKKIVEQALYIMQKYESNMFLVRMPNPSIELVKHIIRENCLINEVQYVFYDYIFVCPSLLSEFKGVALRNDEILLMFSTALKELAVENHIFIMSATQVNANADHNENIRNESSIAGSRAVINKADVGMVMARPSKEELEILSSLSTGYGEPNLVTDIYKVRSGKWTQVRIWSQIDLGTLKKKDMFITDSRLNVIPFEFSYNIDWEEDGIAEVLEELNRML